MPNTPKIFTLKQVVNSIRKTIEERYHQTYWVKAEMHKLNRYPSGHCFPELLQKEDGRIVAQMSGSIWKHHFDRINQRFMEVVKEPLKEDTTLLMEVKVAFHESYGLSLQIVNIDPNYALGELQRERQETLQRLQKEGLLNANQLLSFPLLPKRIAVISGEASKGLSDFHQVIDTNQWKYSFFTLLFPAYVQGDQAAESIMHQLKRIEHVKEYFDVVVLVRGGGGEVGLSCYNNYELCKAIASFPLPVLTGIGHSTNLTVAEMIAYRNAITPTELGDFLLQAFHHFSVPLQNAEKSIQQGAQVLLNNSRHQFKHMHQRFQTRAQQSLREQQHALLSKSQQLVHTTRSFIRENDQLVERKKREVVHESMGMIKDHNHELNMFEQHLPLHAKSLLGVHKNQVVQMEQFVRLMDPINVLKRGFSMTTMNGKTVGIMNQPQVGNKINTRTATFMLESEVISVETQKGEKDS